MSSSKTIFFFLHPRAISAAELGDNGNLTRISIVGKSQAVCESVEDVDRFCEHFLEFYTIDLLTDLNADYFVIDAGAPQEIRARFFLNFKRCPRVSSLFIEQAMPLLLLGKTEFKALSRIDFAYHGNSYLMSAQDGTMKLDSIEASSQNESMAIRDEDFFALVQPSKIQQTLLDGYQEKLRLANAEITELRKSIQVLEKEKAEAVKTAKAQQEAKADQVSAEKRAALKAEAIPEVKATPSIEKKVKEKATPVRKTLQGERVKKPVVELWNKEDIVSFGQHEWFVLERQSGRTLLLAKSAVGRRRFDAKNSNIWEDSEMRAFLNGEFYKKAFSAEEQRKIIETDLETENRITKDKVFLLSLDEIQRYFSSNKSRRCLIGDTPCWYWLRSPGCLSHIATTVFDDGSVSDYGYYVRYAYAVRPAIWVNLDA